MGKVILAGVFSLFVLQLQSSFGQLPRLTLYGKIYDTIEVKSQWKEPGWLVLDEDSINRSAQVTVVSQLDNYVTGDYEIHYSWQNKTSTIKLTDKRYIHVGDTTHPVLKRVGNEFDTIQAFEHYQDLGVTATDNYDKTLKISVTGRVDSSKLGTYPLTYCTKDVSGNSSCVERKVTVIDTIAPMLILRGKSIDTINVYDTYSDPGVLARDSLDKVVSYTKTGKVDSSLLGTYTLEYCAEDKSGNEACTHRTIVVADLSPPIIELIGASRITISQCSGFQDYGYTVSDNYSKGLKVDTTGTWIFNYDSKVGRFTILYKVTDAGGNTDTVSRSIQVKDDIPPKISLLGDGNVYLGLKDFYVDAGVLATDTCNSLSSVSVVESGSFEGTDSVGIFWIKYQATDAVGNMSNTVSRRMVVSVVKGDTVPKPESIADGLAKVAAIYPNPSSGIFQIQLNNHTISDFRISVFDLKGKQLYFERNNETQSRSIDLGHLPKGIYLLKLDGDDFSVSGRLVLLK